MIVKGTIDKDVLRVVFWANRLFHFFFVLPLSELCVSALAATDLPLPELCVSVLAAIDRSVTT